MPLPPDYHMHTHLCRHAEGEAVDLAEQAVRLGFAEIGISEHNPMPRDDWDDWHMHQSDLDAYVRQVEIARRKFPQLAIKLALEVDYIPGQEEWVRQLAARHPWDYLIGAVHYVSDSWALDSPFRISEWKKSDPFEVWKTYFDRQILAVESGLFDIVAHPDLCKKFCFYPTQDCEPFYIRLVDAIHRRGMALELNTAGLRKDCREIYPHPAMVRHAARLGVPITFGSDAHAPREVGANFAEALALARESGCRTSCRYTQRRRELIPVEELAKP